MRTTGAGPVIFNQIPRRGGAFWSHQAQGFATMRAATAAQGHAASKPLFIYAAMFDEVDEGTAMLKAVSTLEETPAAPAQFLYLSVDGTSVPSDFYLSLAGNFTAQWRANEGGLDGADLASTSVWSEEELETARNEALQLTEQKAMARRVLRGAAGADE
jgi:hypothetical protein